MKAERLVEMIEATFTRFGSLGRWYQDPAGVDAVPEVRDQMVRDLAGFTDEPARSELAELCRKWRAQRIEWEGPASYPPDTFIERVRHVIEMPPPRIPGRGRTDHVRRLTHQST